MFMFSIVLLGSCSKIGSENSVPNNLVGHWVDESNFSTNTGTGPSDQLIIVHSNGVCSFANNSGTQFIGSITVDDDIITFTGYRGGNNNYPIGMSWSYSRSGNELELEEIINGGGGMTEGTYVKQ